MDFLERDENFLRHAVLSEVACSHAYTWDGFASAVLYLFTLSHILCLLTAIPHLAVGQLLSPVVPISKLSSQTGKHIGLCLPTGRS